MALLQRIDLFLNNARTPGNVLLTSLSDRSAPAVPNLIEKDKYLLRLRFCDVVEGFTSASTPTELPVDNSIAVGGRKVRGAGLLLFAATTFTKVTVEGPPADVYYQAVLNLNTANLAAAWGSESQITVWVDVQLEAPAAGGEEDNDRASYQFPITLTRQAYDNEPVPAEGDPAYPAPGQLVVKLPVNGAYRFASDGGAGIILQLKNGTTGKYHSLFVTGEDGAEVLTIGPGEV